MKEIKLNNKIIGYLQNNTLGYFHSSTPDSPFSNFYTTKKPFKIYIYPKENKISSHKLLNFKDQHEGYFNSVEQVFAFGKAYAMHDHQAMNQIYNTHSSYALAYKRLGRKVQNYDDYIWQKEAPKWMQIGMEAKFNQDDFSNKALKATKNYRLVEANPYDYKWGCGRSINQDFANSTGQNKQGKALMQVRQILQSEREKKFNTIQIKNFNYKQALKYDKLSKQGKSPNNFVIGMYLIHEKDNNIKPASVTVGQLKDNYTRYIKNLPMYKHDLIKNVDKLFNSANQSTIKNHGKVLGPLIMAHTLKQETKNQSLKQSKKNIDLLNKIASKTHQKGKEEDFGIDDDLDF